MTDEIRRNSAFKRKPIFDFSIQFLAPASILIILVSSVLSAFGVITF